MTRPVTLTQLEVTGIQDYVFGSNNLRQNVGASEWVARATTEWLAGVCADLKLRTNVSWNASTCDLEFKEPQSGAGDGWQAEVIYAGGGNALILFAGNKNETALEFTKALTRRVLRDARGLSLVAGHSEFDRDGKPLSRMHQELRAAVGRKKLDHAPSVPQPGLGVTAACEFTGLPVVGLDKIDRQPISQVVAHKLAGFEVAACRLENILGNVFEKGLDFVYDFDHFGEKGESSYIAVIHADGNGMGKRFDAIADAHPRPEDNDAYLRQVRDLSREIEKQARAALWETTRVLMDAPVEKGKIKGVVPVPVIDGVPRLVFRPIVFGGDDVTFVAEGRLGLSLAAIYLRRLAQEQLPGARAGEKGDPLYARAGVAVVKSHYPFSRAYDLAEDLSRSAKKDLPALLKDGKGIALDWHFSTGGVVLPLNQVRAREYVSVSGDPLTMRPVWVGPKGAANATGDDWRSWDNFEQVTRDLQVNWGSRRNKVKALRDALRRGPEAVKLFLANYGGRESLGTDTGKLMLREAGWRNGRCTLFDPIEAFDFFVDLDGKGKP